MREERWEGPWGHLLGPALHHLGEQGDPVQVDELLGEGDVPRRVGQVLQGLQLGVHAGRLDALVQLDGGLVLGGWGGADPASALARIWIRSVLPGGELTGEVVRRRMEPFLMWLRFCGGFKETQAGVS